MGSWGLKELGRQEVESVTEEPIERRLREEGETPYSRKTGALRTSPTPHPHTIPLKEEWQGTYLPDHLVNKPKKASTANGPDPCFFPLSSLHPWAHTHTLTQSLRPRNHRLCAMEGVRAAIWSQTDLGLHLTQACYFPAAWPLIYISVKWIK